jgi:carbamate kinase
MWNGVLLSLGGNAIIPSFGSGTFEQQLEVTRATMKQVAELLKRFPVKLVVTHGNGPIVGNILVRNEAARDSIPPMPLDVCGADSQGGIGYMIQQVLADELKDNGIYRPVASVVTQVVVDSNDSAFGNPTKPIGPYYSAERAEVLAEEKGWTFVEEKGKGHRRTVPSPVPLEIVEKEVVEALMGSGVLPIAVGGGGIPVVRESNGRIRGVEAVVDKDRASALLARELGLDAMVAVTAVDYIYLDFNTPKPRPIRKMTTREAKAYLAEGQFPPGSMEPKVDAAVQFIESGGQEVVVTSPALLTRALTEGQGTHIVPA